VAHAHLYKCHPRPVESRQKRRIHEHTSDTVTKVGRNPFARNDKSIIGALLTHTATRGAYAWPHVCATSYKKVHSYLCSYTTMLPETMESIAGVMGEGVVVEDDVARAVLNAPSRRGTVESIGGDAQGAASDAEVGFVSSGGQLILICIISP